MREVPKDFATKLQPDVFHVVYLWTPDGARSSSIRIEKAIWINMGGRGDGRGDGVRYPVFHLYNYLDPSKAHTPDSGCRTHAYDDPYLDLDACLSAAREFVGEALRSGRWVPVEAVQAVAR